MTVASEVNRAGPYIGNGVTTSFPYGFRIVDAAHIKVIRAEAGAETTLILNTDYSVSGVGDEGGGTITASVAPSIAQTIIMLRDIPFTQDIDLENQGPYFAETMERGFDLATMRDQQLSERLNRAIIVPESSSGIDLPALIVAVLQVEGNADNINAVAAISSDVTAVADIVPDILSVPAAQAAVATDRAATHVDRVAADASAVAAAAAAAGLTGVVGQAPPGGRLTLTSGVPVPSSDVAAATNIFYTPTVNSQLQIYDATSGKFIARQFIELVLALDPTAGHTGYHVLGGLFDLFVINDGGTIRLGTGPAWSSTTARGAGVGTTEIYQLSGVWVNKNTMALRYGNGAGDTVSVAANCATYVGTFYAAVAGQAFDTKQSRLLWNAYNAMPRKVSCTDTVNFFNYSAAAWQAFNASLNNVVTTITGLDGGEVSLTALAIASNSTATPREVYTGIGLNRTNASDATHTGYQQVTSTDPRMVQAFYEDAPPKGFNAFYWLQAGFGSETQSWYGTNGGVQKHKAGLFGRVWS